MICSSLRGSGLDEFVVLVPCFECVDVDTLLKEILVLVEWVVTRAELVVWWTHCLLET